MAHLAVIGLRGIPDVMGGIETHCAQLLPRMSAQAGAGNLRITVIGRKGYVSGRGRFDGVDQVALWAPRNRTLETILHSALAILYARFGLRADAVHLHAIGPGLMAPLVRLLGMRLLFTHHGEDYRRQKWGPGARFALRLGEVLSLRCADKVVTVSRATAARLKARYPRQAGKVTHIPNGVPPSAAPAQSGVEEALGLTRGRYLITVGRLVPEKAQDLLIEAFAQAGLAAATPPRQLVIVGDADHQSIYAENLRARAEPGVIFAGRLPREQVMDLYRTSALFVLPSYHEGLSIAALEAIQSGAPVLLSDIEANRDIGLPASNYFTAGSVDDLAAKLARDPGDYSVPGDFDISAFDWDRIAARTLAQLAEFMPGAVSPATADPAARKRSEHA